MILTVLALSLGIGSAEAEEVPQYVVVHQSAAVRTAPVDDSASIALNPHGWSESYVFLERISESDGWTRVQTASTLNYAGIETLSHLGLFQITLYVRSESLIPISTQAQVFTDGDGLQSIALPGVPLAVQQGTHVIAARPDLGPIPNPDAVRLYDDFEPRGVGPWIDGEAGWLCEIDQGLLAPNTRCEESSRANSGTILGQLLSEEIRTRRTYRVREDAQGTIALVREKDWLYREIRVLPESAHAIPGSPSSGGIFGAMGSPLNQDRLEVLKDTPVYWESGELAGKIRRTESVPRDMFMARSNGLRCMLMPVKPSAAATAPLFLCLRPEDLR